MKDIINTYIQNDPKNIIRLANKFGVSITIIESWAWGTSIPPTKMITNIVDFITEELLSSKKNIRHHSHHNPLSS